MKKNGTRWKRLGAIMLAAALMASALQPAMAAEGTKGREETAVEEAVEREEAKAVETTGAVESIAEETKDSADKTTTEATAEPTETESTDEAQPQETEASGTEATDVETTAATEEKPTEVENSEESKEDGEALDTYADGEKVAESILELKFFRLSEGGNWISTEASSVKGQQDITLKELGISLPEMKPGYKGIKQVGWADDEGNLVSGNTKLSRYNVFMAVYEEVPILVDYCYRNKEGESVRIEKSFVVPADNTYADVKAMLEKEASPADSRDDLKFQKWEVTLSGGYTDKSFELGDKVGIGGECDVKFRMEAVYEEAQKTIEIICQYIDSKGQWKIEDSGANFQGSNNYSYKKLMTVGETETYSEIQKRAIESISSDLSKEYEIDHWEILEGNTAVTDERNVPENNASITMKAVYKDTYFNLRKGYYDNAGRWVYTVFPMKVAEGTTKEELIQTLKEDKSTPPSTYPGLRFDKWNIENSALNNYIVMDASYENCIIRYQLGNTWTCIEWGYGAAFDRVSEGFDPVFCQVAEKGETVSVQRKFEGYEDVVLYWGDGDNYSRIDRQELEQLKTFVVNGNMTFRGDGVKLSDIPKDPENPENPETPTPVDPATVVDQINNAEAGETIVVDMKDTTVVEKEILEAAKGKDVNIRFDMGSYCWTINGKSIQEGGVKDVNLEVKLDTGVIAESIVGRIAGNLPTRQMSITYDGEFGFTATLSINLGAAYAGKYGNLFYYAGRSRLDFMSAQKVEANGVISVPFTHASDYVFILSDTAMSEKNGTNAGQGTNNQAGGSAKTDGKDGKSVTTGDTTKVFPFVLTGGMALFVLLYIFKKQYAKTK